MLARISRWTAVACFGVAVLAGCGSSGSTSGDPAPRSGGLDGSFGNAGTVLTPFGSGLAIPGGVAIQPDGRLVVAGREQTELADWSRIVLARYEANGGLDAGFGAGGKVATSFGTYDEAAAVALQPDGKIAVAGFTSGPGGYEFQVVRYGSSGSLDPAFGIGGRVTTTFPAPWSSAIATGIAIQPDGKIVAAGAAGPDLGLSRSGSIAIVRYQADGALDTTFGVGGVVITSLPGADCFALGLTLQSGGKILVSGVAFLVNGTEESLLARYGADGTPDAGFGTGGVVRTTSAAFSQARAVVVRPDGKILTAGWSQDRALGGGRTSAAVVLARYGTDGSLDGTFGTAGVVTTRFSGNAGAFAIALQGNGGIVAVGYFWATTATRISLALFRYEAGGRLDPTFANAGMATTDVAFTGSGVAIQPDGRIVVVGEGERAASDSTSGFAVARFVP